MWARPTLQGLPFLPATWWPAIAQQWGRPLKLNDLKWAWPTCPRQGPLRKVSNVAHFDFNSYHFISNFSFLFHSTPTDGNDKKFINIYLKERWGPWSNWIFRLTGHIDLLNIRQSMAQLKSLFNSKKVVPTSMYQACFASFKEDVTSTRTALKKKDHRPETFPRSN